MTLLNEITKARQIADSAQYGWCESEGNGIKEPGMTQLQNDIAQALRRQAIESRNEALEEAAKVCDISLDYLWAAIEIRKLKSDLETKGE